jgi:hypothetical protein
MCDWITSLDTTLQCIDGTGLGCPVQEICFMGRATHSPISCLEGMVDGLGHACFGYIVDGLVFQMH